MELNKWIGENHNELQHVIGRITSNHALSDELYQEVILQLLEKPDKINALPDNQKMFYFIRVVKNNWHSNTSPFQYRRQQDLQRHIPYDHSHGKSLLDERYEENGPSMEWVIDQLNTLDWFNRDLFKMWIDLGTYTKVSQDTTIPLNSVGKYIKETMHVLNVRWDKEIKKRNK
jgi:DNA-directed RNA polymerase specialized sigma24 family protein